VRTDNTLVKFSPNVIELQGWIGAPTKIGLTLPMTMDVKEFIAVGKRVLPMLASLSGTVSEVVQS
jgi:hypothetical protein